LGDRVRTGGNIDRAHIAAPGGKDRCLKAAAAAQLENPGPMWEVASERFKLGPSDSFEEGFHARRSFLRLAGKGHNTSGSGRWRQDEKVRKDYSDAQACAPSSGPEPGDQVSKREDALDGLLNSQARHLRALRLLVRSLVGQFRISADSLRFLKKPSPECSMDIRTAQAAGGSQLCHACMLLHSRPSALVS
jgi:hypothetical protein